jgi:arsenate reductase (thioredoxin)
MPLAAQGFTEMLHASAAARLSKLCDAPTLNMTLTLDEIRQICDAEVREHGGAVEFGGVTSVEGDTNRVEVLISVAGGHEPYRFMFNIDRSDRDQFQREFKHKLRDVMSARSDMTRFRVLFLCTGNSARSQMAEALLRKLSHGRADVFSAGTHPQDRVHPLALRTLEDHFDVDTVGLHPKNLDQFTGQQFDYVITLCDRASETCPVFPGDPERIHWSFEDPSAVEGDEARLRAFETVARDLAARIRVWMALPSVQGRLEGSSGDRPV